MKAKVIDSTEHLRQQQPPRLEDTPQYKEALVNATNDLLGETIGNLGDARARVALYERSLQQLQQQNQTLHQQLAEQQETPPANPEELEKLQRRLDAETRERQALEGQLKELRKKAQEAEALQAQLNSMRRHRDEAQEELEQAHQEAAKQNHDNEQLRARVKDQNHDNAALLNLVADIRAAAGDPDGKLMQEDLVKHIEQLVANQKKPRKKAAPKKK